MKVWTHQMHHNFVICLQEPHLCKHCQADVQAVAAGQNASEGSPMDSLVALAQQELGMSDVTFAAKEILRRLNCLNQHGHQDDTTPLGECLGYYPYTCAQSWDYAISMTAAFHALYNYI